MANYKALLKRLENSFFTAACEDTNSEFEYFTAQGYAMGAKVYGTWREAYIASKKWAKAERLASKPL